MNRNSYFIGKIIYISVFTAQLTEDFCGVEPITHPPIELETRRPPIIDEDKLRKAYNQVDSAILGSKCCDSNLFQGYCSLN